MTFSRQPLSSLDANCDLKKVDSVETKVVNQNGSIKKKGSILNKKTVAAIESRCDTKTEDNNTAIFRSSYEHSSDEVDNLDEEMESMLTLKLANPVYDSDSDIEISNEQPLTDSNVEMSNSRDQTINVVKNIFRETFSDRTNFWSEETSSILTLKRASPIDDLESVSDIISDTQTNYKCSTSTVT